MKRMNLIKKIIPMIISLAVVSCGTSFIASAKTGHQLNDYLKEAKEVNELIKQEDSEKLSKKVLEASKKFNLEKIKTYDIAFNFDLKKDLNPATKKLAQAFIVKKIVDNLPENKKEKLKGFVSSFLHSNLDNLNEENKEQHDFHEIDKNSTSELPTIDFLNSEAEKIVANITDKDFKEAIEMANEYYGISFPQKEFNDVLLSKNATDETIKNIAETNRIYFDNAIKELKNKLNDTKLSVEDKELIKNNINNLVAVRDKSDKELFDFCKKSNEDWEKNNEYANTENHKKRIDANKELLEKINYEDFKEACKAHRFTEIKESQKPNFFYTQYIKI